MAEPDEELPPHDGEVEWQLLACLVEKPGIWRQFSQGLFYLVEVRVAYRVMVEVCKAMEESPGWQRQAEFIRKCPQGAKMLADALERLPSAEEWVYWHGRLKDLAAARALWKLRARLTDSIDLVSKGQKEELATIERELRQINPEQGTAGVRTYREVIPDVMAQIEADWESDGGPRGLPTGFVDMDRILGGLQPGRFYVIGARPGMGKSSLVLGMAEGAAEAGSKVLVVSLEMSAEELVGRSVSSNSRINLRSFRTRDPAYRASEREFVHLARATTKVAKMNITIADRMTSLGEILTTAQMQIAEGCNLVIVDFLQLVHIPNFQGNRNELVTEISTSLKGLAHRNKIAVVAAAQLGRQNEREKRAPNMSDLRDSGSIEQDADAVMLLHADTDERKETSHAVEVIIAKNRGGYTGGITLTFLKEYTRFESASKIDADDYKAQHNDP